MRALLHAVRQKLQKGALLLTALLSVAALYYCVTLGAISDAGAEDGAYVALAQALATGQGYVDLWLTDPPPQTKYPFLFPLILSPLYLLSGFNSSVFRLTVLAFGLAGLILAYVLLRTDESATALLAVLATAFSESFSHYSRAIFPEIPFMAFMFAALIFGTRYSAQHDIISLNGFLTFGSFVCAYFTRLIAICFVPALVIAIIAQKNGMPPRLRMIKAFTVFSLFMLPPLLWSVITHTLSPVSNSYFQELFSDPYSEGVATLSLISWCVSVMKNIYAYVFYAVPHVLTGFNFTHRSVIAGLITIIVVAGFIQALRKDSALLPQVLFVSYMAILFVWPWSKISGSRFIIPLLPLLYYYFFCGISTLEGLFPGQRITVIATIVTAVILGTSNLYGLSEGARTAHQENALQTRFFEAARWVKQNSDPREEIMMLPSPSFFLHSGRKIVSLRCPVTESGILSVLEKRRPSLLLITDRVGEKEQRCYNEVILSVARRYPEYFTLAYAREGNRVYRLRSDLAIAPMSGK